MLDLGAGQVNGMVMHIDDCLIELSNDGGNTSKDYWLDDIVDITIF